MFALAYVILPFSDALSVDAIRASPAPFQRGQRGDLPEGRLFVFMMKVEALLEDATQAHSLLLQIRAMGQRQGGPAVNVSTKKVLDEMRRRGLAELERAFRGYDGRINEFYDRFSKGLDRHPIRAPSGAG